MGEIRFVGTGETRGYPYLVCKKYMYTYSISFDFFNINAKETNSGIVTIEYNSIN